MQKLIQELKRREVFRTVGLYIGGIWIALQVAEVVLPTYNAPDWIMKALISAGIIGLPIAIAMAWFFDLTTTGLHRESEAEASKPITDSRKIDFVVIGVLSVALSISLIVNFMPRSSEPTVMEPISILIADFENTSGDSVFDGALEQALSIAVEESSFVTTYDRNSANRVLDKISESAALDESGARLVSAREGIDLVISGSLAADKSRYKVGIVALDAANGDELARLEKFAESKSRVLPLVSELAVKLREELGDVNAGAEAKPDETFTTESVEAMHDYVNAQNLARDGRDGQAIELYRSAVQRDPQFGRAWSGLAVSADKLGQNTVAAEAWKKAFELLDGMTERERFRTAGVYYGLFAGNSQKAIENYEQLVTRYPADNAGYNNLAFAYFMSLQFDQALEAGRKVVEIYPSNSMYHANYSLYAMYANDLETALAAAEATLKLNPNYHKAYLPFAASALIDGDTIAAQDHYKKMAETGTRGASLASTGMADLMMWSGDMQGAELALRDGIELDESAGNRRAMATKLMMQAEAWHKQSIDTAQVVDRINESLALSQTTSQKVSAALLYLELGSRQAAAEIAATLVADSNPQRQAYGKLIESRLLPDLQSPEALLMMQEAVELADLWLLRFHLGQAHLKAGSGAEAALEFAVCRERLGEAYSLFLNDTPTFRFTASLGQWQQRAKDSLKVQAN